MAMGLTFCVVVFGPNWVQSNSLFASGLGVVSGPGRGFGTWLQLILSVSL